MKERNSVWEACYTVPSSLYCVFCLQMIFFSVVPQGLPVNLLEILPHPLVLMVVDSCPLLSKQSMKAGCKSTGVSDSLGLEPGGRTHLGCQYFCGHVCRSGIKGRSQKIRPSLEALCLRLIFFLYMSYFPPK